MQVSEAALEEAWHQVVARFPFPGYLDKLPHGHVGIARTVQPLSSPRIAPAGFRRRAR